MRKKVVRRLPVVLFVLALLMAGVLVGCRDDSQLQAAIRIEGDEASLFVDGAKAPKSLSAWLTYWRMDDVSEELDVLGHDLDSISLFETYFDEADHLIIPEGFAENIATLQSTVDFSNYDTIWLTIVNDIRMDDEQYSLKDTDLLRRLFASKKTMNQHIDEIVAMAKQMNVDGVEIDYENFVKDKKLWKSFGSFSKKLATRLEAEGLKLRIILEPGVDFAAISVPKNAEYIIMCYNLYGWNEKRGPKANKEFLEKTVKAAKVLPGEVSFAIATGGYDWNLASGEIRSLDEQTVEEIINTYGVKQMTRDAGSGALYFTYKDADGNKHELWYADGKTLACWQNWICQKKSYNIVLWRLGGNDLNSLQWLTDAGATTS